jgi:ELWxxDGT repeat protein
MSTLQRLRWLVVSAWLLACPAFAFAFADTETGPARLVADLAPGSVPIQGSISCFMRLGSRAVFLRGEPDAGLSLWITDGTVEGTSALGVLCPPCQMAVALGSNGNVAFYKVDASYPVFETAIWRTDGTPAGTFPLTNDLPMETSSPAGSIQGGLLFFTACTAELGCELWSSDGSREGTAPVGEIVPGPGSADIQELAAAGDRAFLIVGEPGGYPAALWVADGRTRGLRRLRTVPDARGLVAAGADRAFFRAWNGRGWEVWASDGTAAGTRPLRFGQRAR